MNRTGRTIATMLFACMLALCAGCASNGGEAASSSSGAAIASESAAAAQAQSAEPDGLPDQGSADASAQPEGEAVVTGEPVSDPANLTDGAYLIEVALEGGSGKAFIESPARVVVDEGTVKLIVVWSSENYDLMIVDGQELYPVPRPGNSTFGVPVESVVDDLSIQAETTAMSEPHLIDYVIHFDPSTLVKTE